MAPGKNSEAKPCLIDKRGRVAVPKTIMSALGVEEGAYITFEIEGGRVVVYPVDWTVKRGAQRPR
jgi:AbrB family looped-hinge helix DNA binding protein